VIEDSRKAHRIGFISLGCPKNLVDSEVMLGMLARQGYAPYALIEDWEEAVRTADVTIVAKKIADPSRLASLLRSDQLVIDLVGLDTLTGALRPWGGASTITAPAAVGLPRT